MRRLGRSPHSLGVVLLILYTVLLPLLVLETTSAHKLIKNGAWRYSVRAGRLDYLNRSDFTYEVAEARYRWRQAGPIAVSETNDSDVAEVKVSDANSCELSWIGKYDYADDKIRFNKCPMNWDGGFYQGTQQNLGPTPQSRRNRTAVHEFGHAQGLDHNSLDDCSSVMSSPVDFDQPTCWVPKTHDVDDINQYWP
jgi:hypothetical protein